jgi:hypothetical protein
VERAQLPGVLQVEGVEEEAEPETEGAAVRYLLVLQWAAGAEADYDALIEMESTLERSMPAAHGDVDGHDYGSGEMNLFICTDEPLLAFEDARAALREDPRWRDVRAAYRPADGDRYVILWPATLQQFEVT